MQKEYIHLKNTVAILSSATVVGKKEFDGPLGKMFDMHDSKNRFGFDSWEKSESEMQHLALNLALSKKKQRVSDIDILFAGDLINQCTCSAQGTLSFDIPYIGLYGACSTAVEGLMLASLLLEGKNYNKAAVVSSSHNSTAERQFRFPLEYGCQRTPTSQWTVTGSAAFILEQSDSEILPEAYICDVMPGRTIDKGITDANNMGAAMAPAAIDTLCRYFSSTKTTPDNYDLIVTGDLGREGHGIVSELMATEGYDMSRNYTDCGLLIYDIEKQDMHAGASGCGCSATVLSAYLLPKLKKKELNNILFIGTGALMSQMSVQQGLSIPGIAHLVRISSQHN